ncbi:two-component system response regulator [Paenibacillus sambharensis]|uniref:Two-component system response regulator n=1 Tax=Paenibacillus sambharensis TaxID=1803190 RepID=A0A2W1LFA3_9BACL|nr:response regulator [Paenibacillus sambharensis]PZD97513.1 two-component system response regulator [Paenibacillus sambharensis]
MFRILIAEDSKPILRNLQSLLNVMELPVMVAATAANGEEALGYIRQHPVDILLTDIRMPKLGGLDLIAEARQLQPELKVVLISGYNDFEYTRRALSLQVFDYLLKPVEKGQLMEVMERVVDGLEQQQAYDRIRLEEITSPEYREKIQLGTEFYAGPKLMLLVRKQPFTTGEKWDGEQLRPIIAKVCEPHCCWAIPTSLSGQVLVLADEGLKDKYPSAYEWLDAIGRELTAQGIPASMISQYKPVEHGDLPEAYRSLVRRLDEQLTAASPIRLDAALPVPDHTRTEAESLDQLMPSFAEMVKQRQKEAFLLKLSEQLRKWYGVDVRIARLEGFLSRLADLFRVCGADPGGWDGIQLAKQSQLYSLNGSYAAFCTDLLTWAKDCMDMLQTHSRKSSQELYDQIDEYVRMNMYAHLSINDLAQKFHVSPSYISRIMKRHAKTTFVHYYMGLKIKEACRLMKQKPKLKVKDISDLLAFGDQHYFSRVFKEHAGCSPTMFKEQSAER